MTPIGTIVAFCGNSLPQGYLLCNGAAISRETYAGLFNVIGITYGSGDGTSTFNLPNLNGKFIQGGEISGEVKKAGIPNIFGELGPLDDASKAVVNGPFYYVNRYSYDASSTGTGNGWRLGFDASRVSSVYGSSNTVQPPAIVMRFLVKY